MYAPFYYLLLGKSQKPIDSNSEPKKILGLSQDLNPAYSYWMLLLYHLHHHHNGQATSLVKPMSVLENGFTRTSAFNFCVRFCQLSNDGMTPTPLLIRGTLQQLNI